MFPFIRMIHQLAATQGQPKLPLTGTHVSHHRCWPWDIAMWMGLNNGHTLTLFDMGRVPLAQSTGLIVALRRNRFGLTMAGASVRWRQRVRAFEMIEMQSRCVGRDHGFIYIEQSMWKANGACANHALYRSVVTGPKGIVPTAQIMESLGVAVQSPALPGWARAWIDADATRSRPPERAAA